MGTKRTLSGWLTNRYLLIIRNEENFAEKKTISFNYARVLLLFAVFFIVLLGLALYIVTSLLNQWLDPRYTQTVANRQVIQMSMAIDSMEQEMSAKEKYIQNIRLILEGQDSIYAALVEDSDEIDLIKERALNSNYVEIDSQFRAAYELDNTALVKFSSAESSELRDLYFFKPIEGIVSDYFDPGRDHYGTDIVAKENEPVKSIADGIVIFSSWTLESGYVIGIQHTKGSLISVYKHNSDLLKNVGSFVTGGEIIAIIGNTGELTSGPHLHFELWHKGGAVNPEDYIAF